MAYGPARNGLTEFKDVDDSDRTETPHICGIICQYFRCEIQTYKRMFGKIFRHDKFVWKRIIDMYRFLGA